MMSEREEKAMRKLLTSTIACVIDIGRAIQHGGHEIRAAAIAHSEDITEQIKQLTTSDYEARGGR